MDAPIEGSASLICGGGVKLIPFRHKLFSSRTRERAQPVLEERHDPADDLQIAPTGLGTRKVSFRFGATTEFLAPAARTADYQTL
jgi:hypothetical protein